MCLFGDFNAVRSKEEHKRSLFDKGKADDFNNFICHNDLQEMSLGGWKFT